MSVSCQILLKKTEEGIYRPGQTVAGTVMYSIDEPMKFGSVNLHFVGNGSCEWPEKDSDDKIIYHRNKEEYFKQYRNLFIVREDQDNVLSGNFEYPFEFTLPDYLPTSMTNHFCTIEYKIIVTFMKENLFETEYEFIEEVPVYGYVSPCSAEPMIFGLQKELFSLTKKNNINIKAEIDKTFVTPGENMKVKLIVNNNTDMSITVKTELYKYFTYIAEGEFYRKYERVPVKMTKVYSPLIEEKSVTEFTCVVPALPSLYSIQHSKILIGEFRVRVTAKVPFPHINAVAEVPVVIGESKDHLGVTAVGADDECPLYSEVTTEYEFDRHQDTVKDSFKNLTIQ